MRLLIPTITATLAVLALSAQAASPGGPRPAALAVHASAYGPILFDGRDFALYAFTRDTSRRSHCTGACARRWPPYLVAGAPRAGRGISAASIGTVTRSGRILQATYGGRPLYRYVGDRKPLQVLCQNVREFGGLWLVLRPDGSVVR